MDKINQKKRGRPARKSCEITLDSVEDFVIKCVQAYQQLPELIKERDKYKRGYEQAMDGWNADKKELERIQENRRRFTLAIQQGEIKKVDVVPSTN